METKKYCHPTKNMMELLLVKLRQHCGISVYFFARKFTFSKFWIRIYTVNRCDIIRILFHMSKGVLQRICEEPSNSFCPGENPAPRETWRGAGSSDSITQENQFYPLSRPSSWPCPSIWASAACRELPISSWARRSCAGRRVSGRSSPRDCSCRFHPLSRDR